MRKKERIYYEYIVFWLGQIWDEKKEGKGQKERIKGKRLTKKKEGYIMNEGKFIVLSYFKF
jgi:hypothetical protein